MNGCVSLKEKICYALGDASANIAWRGICAFLLIYYTDVFGLAPLAVGTLFFIVRLSDGVSDIAMGVIGDRTNSRHGKFRPWILWTAIPLAVILSLTFTCPPGLSETGRLVYAYVTYILFTLVYTANNIPYGALMAVMTDDDKERASIGSFRMAGAFAGGMLVQGILFPMAKWFETSPAMECFAFLGPGRGYSLTIYSLSIVLAACLFITFYGTRERVSPPLAQESNLWRDLWDLVRNRPWVVLLVVGLLFNVYNAIRQGITVFYFTHYVHRELLVGGFFSALMLASVVGALATAPLARRFGKRNIFVATLLLAGLVNALFAFCGPTQIATIFAVGVLGEIVAAVFPTLFFTMLGDAADYSEYVNGRRATGLVYSAGSFATKFGGGIAGVIIGGVLAAYGYQGTDPGTIPGAIPGIKLLMGIIPSVIVAATAFLMFLYPLSDKKLSEITAELARRRAN